MSIHICHGCSSPFALSDHCLFAAICQFKAIFMTINHLKTVLFAKKEAVHNAVF